MQHTKISPRLPPTPKPSTELAPRRTHRLSIDSSFNIGPAAITLSPEALKVSSTHSHAVAAQPHPPLSPTSPFSLTAIGNPNDIPKPQQRRRTSSSASTTVGKRKDVVIGPPPTRQHPIIQMKPREVAPATITEDVGANNKAIAGTKRKSAGVSAAKRKIARKTAHSEIERRRRSKMNDQFAKLKSMVPACKNQDMHKLAILEATTEYLAYLEEAIKVYRNAGSDSVINSPPTFSISEHSHGDEPLEYYDEEDDNDADDMAVTSSNPSPALGAIPTQHSVLEITDTEATHALLLLAEHQNQSPMMEGIINFGKSKPISVKDLLL